MTNYGELKDVEPRLISPMLGALNGCPGVLPVPLRLMTRQFLL
jgi:hypothetical protein